MDALTGIALISFVAQVLIWMGLPDSPRSEVMAHGMTRRAMPA